MAAPLIPSVRFTLLLEKVPASEGTDLYKWATKPLADADSWTEGRVIRYGTMTRRMSSLDGDYDIPTIDIVVTDADGLLRGLLADPITRYFTSREAAIELLSEQGRVAGLDWRTVTRGRVTNIQATPGRTASIRIADSVGSHFSGFDLEKEIGVRITRREHPNAKDEVVNRMYPIITGEHSDIGTVDANGDAADKGLLPVIDAGDYLLGEDGTDYTDSVPLAFLHAPENLQITINGDLGQGEATYGVTAVSPYGETTITQQEITVVPDILDATSNVQLDWDPQDGVVEYRVYKNSKLIARLNNGETYVDPETTYTDDGSDNVGGVVPPQTNTAQIDQVIDGQTATGWGRLIMKIGANAEVLEMYASDLGSPPKRTRVPEELYGSEFLVPNRPGWPYADPFIEINGIRMGVAYARGPRLAHHRNNTVTITWNGCGDDDVGDGSGPTITEAFPALLHVLNEYVLRDNGVGYRTGDFAEIELYSNLVPKLKASAFEECQALTVEWIGGRGYQAAIAITEPTSLREFLRRFNVSFASNMGTNHHGQFYPVLINDTADPTEGRLYRDRIEVIAMESQDIDHDAVETKVTYHYDWDAEQHSFRITDQVIEDEEASEAYFVPRERSVRQCYYTRDEATALDASSRHLTRYKVAPRYVEIQTNLLGLEDEIGAQVRLTHYDGAGGVDGDVETPFLVIGHSTNPNASESVTLTLMDLGRIISTGFPLLETDASGAILGDETLMEEPPVGAFELR